MTLIAPPAADEFGRYYAGYVAEAPADLFDGLACQPDELTALTAHLDDAGARYRYGPDKWSVKEVVGHLCDAERIFAYRALRFARGDTTPLATFEEDAYVAQAEFDRRPLADLVAEFRALRQSTVLLFRGLTDDQWARRGEAAGAGVSVRALAHIIAGHAAHHMRVLRERYGLERGVRADA